MKNMIVMAMLSVLLSATIQSNSADGQELSKKKADTPKTSGNATLAGKSDIDSITLDTYRADALDKNRSYGFGTDSFFGAVAMLENAGLHKKSSPMPLVEKTINGFNENKFSTESFQVIAYYFGRLGRGNPDIVRMYEKRWQESEGLDRTFMLSILSFCQDAKTKLFVREVHRNTLDPKEKDFLISFLREALPEFDIDNIQISGSLIIELLWAEYLATKDMRAIRRIAGEVTNSRGGVGRAIISVASSSTLAQRGGWFNEVETYCRDQQNKTTGEEREIWKDIVNRMKELNDGRESIRCPIERIQLDGVNGRAMACSAMWTRLGRGRLDVLGAFSLDCDNISHTRNLLYEWWGVSSRSDLLASMEWLYNEGHRAEFNERTMKLLGLGEEQIDSFIDSFPEDQRIKWEIIRDHGINKQNETILGWDMGRITLLARLGYEAQYLSSAEVYRIAVPVALELQETFDSWKEYAENVAIGRWYWRGSHKDFIRAKTANFILLNTKSSPWKKYPWGIPMQEGL